MSRSVSGINPLFQGDISRAALAPDRDTPSHQSFNPVFRALPAQYGQLELGGSSSWQLQGLTANARTTAQEMTALAWSQSASSSSQGMPAAPTAQTEARLDLLEDLPADHEALLTAQLLADDRQDSAEWVSSSSSSEGVVPPLRSLSFPNVGAFRREEVGRFKALGRDTSLPVSVQSGLLPAGLWSSGRPQLPAPTLRQRFMQEQQPGSQADPPVGQEAPEQVDIWAALERQPSPIITLRQRYASAELQQDIQGQGSSMQPPQAVLELFPQDIILQEPSLDETQAAFANTVLPQEPGTSEQHQQSGLQPQVAGVSARSVARRMSAPRRQAVAKRLSELKKLSTAELTAPSEVAAESDTRAPTQLNKLPPALYSEPAFGTDESANKGVHFGSAAADEREQGSWQQARTLTRAKSSLKQARSPQISLRRRSFRSAVSFAPISTESDSSSDGGVGGKGPISASAFTAAPLLKTMSSVWASITGSRSGGTLSAAAATAVAGYAPTRVESHHSYGDPPILKPPRPLSIASPSRHHWQAASKQATAAVAADSKPDLPLKAGPSKWQAASRKATTAVIAPSMPSTPSMPAKRPMSRFGSFFDVVTEATAVHGKASLSRRLGQEHVEMGVRMLLEACTLARAESQKGAPPQQDSSLQAHPSLAKVMQVLSAKHMSKSVSMASTVQVRAVTAYCQQGTMQASSGNGVCSTSFTSLSAWLQCHAY